MTAEHRRPLVAFLVLSALCLVVAAAGLRGPAAGVPGLPTGPMSFAGDAPVHRDGAILVGRTSAAIPMRRDTHRVVPTAVALPAALPATAVMPPPEAAPPPQRHERAHSSAGRPAARSTGSAPNRPHRPVTAPAPPGPPAGRGPAHVGHPPGHGPRPAPGGHPPAASRTAAPSRHDQGVHNGWGRAPARAHGPARGHAHGPGHGPGHGPAHGHGHGAGHGHGHGPGHAHGR